MKALCFSTTQSANRCASLQELLQLLVLPVSKQCSLSLYIRDLYIKEHIEISSCFSLNESSVFCARLQNYNPFSFLGVQNFFPSASILEALIEILSCYSLNDSLVFCARLQNELQISILPVSKPFAHCLYIRDA